MSRIVQLSSSQFQFPIPFPSNYRTSTTWFRQRVQQREFRLRERELERLRDLARNQMDILMATWMVAAMAVTTKILKATMPGEINVLIEILLAAVQLLA